LRVRRADGNGHSECSRSEMLTLHDGSFSKGGLTV
jgi:hypothetical protein